jgi:hypothetical protein
MADYPPDQAVACPQVLAAAHQLDLEAECQRDPVEVCQLGQKVDYRQGQAVAYQQVLAEDCLQVPEVGCPLGRVVAFQLDLEAVCPQARLPTIATFRLGQYS